jgi:NADH dehydrogenase
MKYPVATVFGGSGFLGHAVVQALASRGYQVRVPTRDLERTQDLLLMGEVGQIVPFLACVKSEASVAEMVRGADVVINLIGEIVDRGKNGFQLVHVETAARLSRLSRAGGVKHFVHVSALGAEMKSKARYARSKAIGEEAVRAFFPDAVIVRPGIMFGPRDSFLNRFALYARYLPVMPLIGGGQTRFQPVYVGDVAQAIMAAIDRPEAKGRLYVLGGPKVYTFQEMMGLLLATLQLKRPFVFLPWWLARVMARFFEALPNPPLTLDQVELLARDNTVRQQHGGRAPDLASLGISPTSLDDVLPTYLRP